MTRECPFWVGQTVRWIGWYSVVEKNDPEEGAIWIETYWKGKFPVSRLDLLPAFPNEEWL